MNAEGLVSSGRDMCSAADCKVRLKKINKS